MARQPGKTLAEIEAELNPVETKVDKRTEKKRLIFEREPNGLYRIVFTNGGEVPDQFKGMFTNRARVEALIAPFNESVNAQAGSQ